MLAFSFLYMFIKNFSKRLIPLLSLEAGMLLILWLLLSEESGACCSSVFSYSLVLLIFMVVDSVLGICMLIGSCRASLSWSSLF